jgi:hypothetical protein
LWIGEFRIQNRRIQYKRSYAVLLLTSGVAKNPEARIVEFRIKGIMLFCA